MEAEPLTRFYKMKVIEQKKKSAQIFKFCSQNRHIKPGTMAQRTVHTATGPTQNQCRRVTSGPEQSQNRPRVEWTAQWGEDGEESFMRAGTE